MVIFKQITENRYLVVDQNAMKLNEEGYYTDYFGMQRIYEYCQQEGLNYSCINLKNIEIERSGKNIATPLWLSILFTVVVPLVCIGIFAMIAMMNNGLDRIATIVFCIFGYGALMLVQVLCFLQLKEKKHLEFPYTQKVKYKGIYLNLFSRPKHGQMQGVYDRYIFGFRFVFMSVGFLVGQLFAFYWFVSLDRFLAENTILLLFPFFMTSFFALQSGYFVVMSIRHFYSVPYVPEDIEVT